MEDKTNHINQILDFYTNPALSKGFDNGFFKEGDVENLIMSRLERAVINDICGGPGPSRYAIWATGLTELIQNAVKSIHDNNSVEAMRLLQIAGNSLRAYKDIQVLMDREHLYSVNKLLKGYAMHLLSVDDKGSRIVEKDDISKQLKIRSHISGTMLPRDIDLSIKNDVLYIFIKKPTQNMQVDSAAFEGWIMILKSWFSDEIKYVVLDFELPAHLSDRYGTSEVCHYNRFLYRLNNFSRLFPDWFFIHESKSHIIDAFMKWIKSSTCLLNHSLRERESVIKTDKMERQIESWFAFEEGKEKLCELWNIEPDKLFNQLPIGVFYEKITSKNSIFTRGASAIDLWGIGEDKETLHLIELKCGDNKGIGVISELLFYISVLYDSCVTEDTLFTFGKYGNTPETTDLKAIKNGGKKFSRLNAHILAEKYHPLFSNAVENLLRGGLSSLRIDFDRALYDYSKKVLYENNDL